MNPPVHLPSATPRASPFLGAGPFALRLLLMIGRVHGIAEHLPELERLLVIAVDEDFAGGVHNVGLVVADIKSGPRKRWKTKRFHAAPSNIPISIFSTRGSQTFLLPLAPRFCQEMTHNLCPASIQSRALGSARIFCTRAA